MIRDRALRTGCVRYEVTLTRVFESAPKQPANDPFRSTSIVTITTNVFVPGMLRRHLPYAMDFIFDGHLFYLVDAIWCDNGWVILQIVQKTIWIARESTLSLSCLILSNVSQSGQIEDRRCVSPGHARTASDQAPKSGRIL